MDSADLQSTLRRLGLSGPERAAYLAVLGRGEVASADLAADLDLSAAALEDAVATLAERGFVEREDADGQAIVSARPPSAAAEQLSTHVAAFEAAAAERYADETAVGSAFSLLESPAAVRRRLRREVGAAERELLAVLPGSTVGDLLDDLASAVERGVTVYVLVTAPRVDDAVAELVPGEHVTVLRSWGAPPALFLLRDVTAAVLGHADAAEDADVPPTVAVRQPTVAGWLYGNAVGNIWPSGTQRGLADPPPLPATFEHFRSGVTAAALHDLEGTQLAVDVEGTELATGDAASLSGAPVRDVRQSLVEPANVDFPVETALVVETDAGLVSVGADTPGLAAFHEDYAAETVTLYEG